MVMTTLSCILHKAGIYGKLARKKAFFPQKDTEQKSIEFTKRHVGDSPNMWKKVLWLDETKMAQTQLITPRTPSP